MDGLCLCQKIKKTGKGRSREMGDFIAAEDTSSVAQKAVVA
jgi:hypothetical protein